MTGTFSISETEAQIIPWAAVQDFYLLGYLQPSKSLDANRMSALLKVKTHASISQQKSSGRIISFPACLRAPAGNLDGLMNLLAYISTTFCSSTITITNNLIVINSKSWCNGWSSCFQHCGKWCCYPAEALNETLVEICEVDEDLLPARWPFYFHSLKTLSLNAHESSSSLSLSSSNSGYVQSSL